MHGEEAVNMGTVRIIKHEAIPGCGSFEVRYGDGRPQFFHWADIPPRWLRPETLDHETAREQAKATARTGPLEFQRAILRQRGGRGSGDLHRLIHIPKTGLFCRGGCFWISFGFQNVVRVQPCWIVNLKGSAPKFCANWWRR